jgi:prepilin-type N-terminal cleavage/methylation domain-containing protein
MKPARSIPASPQRQPVRNGYSLIEMMVVMTIMGAVLTIGVTGIVRLFRLQSSEVQALSEATVWRRLSRDFRADTHGASTAVCTTPDRLELGTATGLIVWSVEDDTLQRELRPPVEGEAVAESVEHYRLPDGRFVLSHSPREDGRSGIASVVIQRSGGTHTRPTSGRIEAAVGLSRRLQQATTNGGTP